MEADWRAERTEEGPRVLTFYLEVDEPGSLARLAPDLSSHYVSMSVVLIRQSICLGFFVLDLRLFLAELGPLDRRMAQDFTTLQDEAGYVALKVRDGQNVLDLSGNLSGVRFDFSGETAVAETLMAKREFKRCIKDLKRVTRKRGSSTGVQLATGRCFEHLGNGKQAEAAYRSELEACVDRRTGRVGPAASEAYRALAALCRNEGRVEEAAENYQRALELRPRHVEALVEYGLLLLPGDREAAFGLLARALRLGGLSAEVLATVSFETNTPPERTLERLERLAGTIAPATEARPSLQPPGGETGRLAEFARGRRALRAELQDAAGDRRRTEQLLEASKTSFGAPDLELVDLAFENLVRDRSEGAWWLYGEVLKANYVIDDVMAEHVEYYLRYADRILGHLDRLPEIVRSPVMAEVRFLADDLGDLGDRRAAERGRFLRQAIAEALRAAP